MGSWHVMTMVFSQAGRKKKKSDAEPQPSQRDADGGGEGPPVEKPKKMKSPSSYFPYPDTCPPTASSEDEPGEDEPDEYEPTDMEEDDDVQAQEPVCLHEDLHEELYGIPTPKKPALPSSSSVPAAGEKQQSVDLISDDEGIESPDKVDKKATTETTGTHKEPMHLLSVNHIVIL